MENEFFEQRTDLSRLSQAVTQIKETLGQIIVGQQDSIDLLIAGIVEDARAPVAGHATVNIDPAGLRAGAGGDDLVLADNVRTTDHNDIFPGQIKSDLFDHDHHTVRGAWLKSRLADHEATDIVGVKTVNILARIDRFDYFLRRESFRQRQLHDQPADFFV